LIKSRNYIEFCIKASRETTNDISQDGWNPGLRFKQKVIIIINVIIIIS
jgi:hypothetical protein